MKKSKRILSLLTALTITASAFASIVIPASAADTTYFTVDFSSPATTGISAQGTTAQNSVAYGDYLTFSMGARGDGGDGVSNITIDDGALKITSGKYASSQRGASIAFASTAGVPAFANIDAGNVLEIAFDAKYQDAVSTIQFFGITSSKTTGDGDPYLSVAENPQIPANEWIKVKLSVANDQKAYATITDSDGALLSAKSFTAAGSAFEKIGFYGGTTAVWIDNLSVKQVANTYKNLTINVATSDSTPVTGATVKVGKASEVVTGSSLTLGVPAGTYPIEVSKAGYEANAGQKDAATDSATVIDADVTKNIVLNEQSYVPEPDVVNITGGQLVMTSPKTANELKSAAFTVASVIDQNDVDRKDESTIEWSITPADDHVSIDQNGVVTVTKGFTAGETHVKDFTVTATATIGSNSKSATKTLLVSDYLFYEPGVGGSSYGTVETATVDGVKYISTPNSTRGKTTDIVLPEPIEFTPGTAEILTFKTAVTNVTGAVFKRTITFTDDSETPEEITSIGYINTTIGDANNATWQNASPGSSFNEGAAYATLSGANAWMDVAMLMKTNATGATSIQLTFGTGEDAVSYDLGKTDAKNLAKISLLYDLANSNDRYVVFKDFVVDAVDVTGMGITGSDNFTSVAGVTVEKKYEIDAMVIQDNETFEWSTDKSADGVTITPSEDTLKATLSVPGTFTGTIKVSAVSSTSTEQAPKKADKDVTIAAATVASAEIVGTTTVQYEEGATETYTLANVKDQNGDDITEYVTPAWSLKGREVVTLPNATFTVDASAAGGAVAIFPVYEGTALKSVTTAPVKITGTSVVIEGKNGQKVLLWDSLDGIKPLAAAGTITGTDVDDVNYITNTGTLNINVKQDETVVATVLGTPIEKPVTVADFSKFVTIEEAGEISVADIVTYGTTSFSVVLDDGTVVEKTAADNKITLSSADFGDATEAEIIPNYKFDLGGASESGYVKVAGTKADGYGFKSTATPAAGTGTGIQSKGVDLDSNSFEVDLPDGRYDMTFYKADTNRTHIRVNGYQTVTEADFNDGDDGTYDPLEGPGVYTKLDVNVEGGVASITAKNWDKGVPKMAAVEITKKSEDFQPRKTHVWIAGDSTVCIYRPSPTTDNFAAGTRRTGWGQLLQNYLSDDVIVDDFAHSGDWAANWYANTFPSVLNHAEKGDYLIIQFGINDRTRTPDQAVMKAALVNMVDECRAKGVIPVIQTPELCISQYGDWSGKEEHTKPTGSGHEGYFKVNKTVAEEKNTLLIDLGDISATMWATMGKTWVSRNYFLWNLETNAQRDAQHMSYVGAKLVASMVATEILDQQTAGKTGAAGETFNGIPVNAKVQANITYTDASDNTEKTIERQAAEFKATVTAD